MRAVFILMLAGGTALAQAPEDFRVEITASGWKTKTEGELRAGGTAIDIRTDLGIAERWLFHGKGVFKLGRRHRIFAEGIPYHLEGDAELSRDIDFGGTPFPVRAVVSTVTDLTYIAAGYQIDFISSDSGHLGLQLSGAYLDATARIVALGGAISAEENAQVGLPLAGVEGRVFLIPGKRWLFVEGEVKGMYLVDYGQYVQGGAYVGGGVGPFAIRGGWQALDARVRDTDGDPSIAPRFSGFIAGVMLRF